MSQRLPTTPAPGPLEPYAVSFDSLFSKLNQRAAFRLYLTGLLLPAERNKTLTGLANTEPIVSAQHPRAQQLQWFVSESTWDAQAINTRRLDLLRSDTRTAPTETGVLVIDETGDRKAGTKTAHVGRQYLANLGKIDNGVVSVSSLWADQRLYYPLEVEPYTPAQHFEGGKADCAFRTKPEIALELVQSAVAASLPFRAVVADCFYGEHEAFRSGLHALGVGYVLALKPSHTWWHPADEIGSLWEAAHAAVWDGADDPGEWVAIERQFRDGHTEIWWALEVDVGPYSPNKTVRAVVVTTDPAQLPDLTTWYLISNLPAPSSDRATTSTLAAASLEEMVRLYGLRMWVEQSYKQVKGALGWAEYQVRSDQAIRRHWTLVCCAFTFCWWHTSSAAVTTASSALSTAPQLTTTQTTSTTAERKKKQHRGRAATGRHVAGGVAPGAGMVGALGDVAAILARVVASAPTARIAAAAGLGMAGQRYRPLHNVLADVNKVPIDLIGIWSADARYSAGAPSDEILLFKEDGTGRMEFWNWQLCSVDFFRWQVVSPGAVDLIGFRCLELPEEGDDPVEVETTFRYVRVPFSVAEEDTPSGKRMRVLRIGLARPYPSELGFMQQDFAGWEEPRS